MPTFVYPCVYMMFFFWLFVSIMGVFCPCSGENLLHAHSPGDIIIGGLFPIHIQTNRNTTPGPLTCRTYDLQMFLRTQVMIYAINEINQRTPSVLPNFTVGYDIYDTCGDVSLAIRATLQLLTPESCLEPSLVPPAFPEPITKAVIGERYSEVSVAVARVLALSAVTQISYGSTSELLSKKLKFPTFLRTVSSDEYQTKAIAELVRQFKWQTVVIVGSDDEYGKYGRDSLVDIFSQMKDVCIEFTILLPGYFSQNNSDTHSILHSLVTNISTSSAEAIIIFTKDVNAGIIIEAAIKHNLNRTWIASDAWSTYAKLSAMPGIEKAGEVFGFISQRHEVPGFKDYVVSMFNGTTNAILKDYLTYNPLCSNPAEEKIESNCSLNSQEGSKQCLNPSCLASYIDQDESFNIYLAVEVIVEGLRRLLKCDNHKCERNATFTALELFMEIKNVNFTVNNTHISFDSNGDPSLGYDIVYWNMTKEGTIINTIGGYWPNQKIQVPEDLVKLRQVAVTAYNCYKTCKPGQELKNQGKLCCNDCVTCEDRQFSADNGTVCKRCGEDQYSSPQRDKCVNKTAEFLQWSDPFTIILSSFGIFGIIASIVFSILFAIYHSTPIVKAVGGYLCFLELFSLLVCFCLTFSFSGRPTEASCMVKLPLFGIAFTLCISCILANLLQILVGFNFDLKIGPWVEKLNKPVAVVTIVSGIQLALCVPWLFLSPPKPIQEHFDKTILHLCDSGSMTFFIAMLGYIAFLAIVSFLFAFKGKQLPDLYKNASLITTSMMLFLMIWILLIPIYINLVGVYKQAIESAAILISSYSILGCHLAPKCYIMMFRKEINNEKAITEYIRKHYEHNEMAVK